MLVIWGIIIFRTVAAFSDDPVLINKIEFSTKKEMSLVKKDTFSLLPLESDPFLGDSYTIPKKKKNQASVSHKKEDWPEIKYLGRVSDSDKPAAIHILEISGNQVLLKRGETAEDVKIMSGKHDRVLLNYKGMRREFTKNN